MNLKISGNSPEHFQENLTRFMNLATLICLRGTVPTERDMTNEDYGRWWYRDGDHFEILKAKNDDKVYIKIENNDHMVVEFFFRYDKDNRKKIHINNLMVSFLDFVEDAA